MPTWQIVLIGCGGAVAAEVYGLFDFRQSTFRGLPDYLKDWWFWFVGSWGVAAAAFFTYLYAISNQEGLSPILAANVGATWPLFIRVGAAKVDRPDTGIVNDA